MAKDTVKFTKFSNSERDAVALDKVSFDATNNTLTLYSSFDNTIKEQTVIPTSSIDLDTELVTHGKAADAKAVGDAIRNAVSMIGSPLVASEISEMTDITKIYVYTGSETGYVNGNWYYYDGTVWVSGGAYNSAVVDTDTTLSIDGKAADAGAVGDAIDGINDDIDAIRDELIGYIDRKAVNGLLYENNFLTLTADGEPVGNSIEIVGGGGGGGSTSVVRLINNNGTTTISTAVGQSVVLDFTFTSIEDEQPTGNGTCRISVNSVAKTIFSLSQGRTTIDVKDYLSTGTNTVEVYVTDVYGVSKRLSYTVTVIDLSISSTFDDSQIYTGDISFKYTPVGAIEKTIHFKIDGVEIGTTVTSASGKQATKVIPFMSHGSHTLEVYATATMDGNSMESNHLLYDIMCVISGNNNVVISSAYQVTSATQGEQLSIPYTVYSPTSPTTNIELIVTYVDDGNTVTYSTTPLTVDRTKQYWNTRRYPIGTVTFTIKCGNVSRSHVITVTENDIDVEPVENDLDTFLSSAGRSNSESNPAVWQNNGITTTFNNFNWANNGWIEDNNGDTTLRHNGNANSIINIQPFDSDLKVYGKTIEIEFAIRDVNNRDAVAISCLNNGIGFTITADTVTFTSQQTTMKCSYGDEERIRLSFVVESDSEDRLMSIYLNGIRSAVKQYPSNDVFHQDSPVSITIGSPYCAVDVYTIRSYSTALSTDEISNNYIADMQDIVEKQLIYEENDVYDSNKRVSYEKMRVKIPTMTIIGNLPRQKGDKKTVTIVYEDPNNPQFNFTDANCTIDVQGTSSQWSILRYFIYKIMITFAISN